MLELKSGEKVPLTNGLEATVVKELGRGGQGIVYLVELGGQKMALKWYLNKPTDWFYKNLEENVMKGAPSDAFLWPEYLTTKRDGYFGYVMKLRPQGYEEFGRYLLARAKFKSLDAIMNAAMKICEGFKALHLSGLSYQDLNDGNFFINPETGDVLICDNDNVAPEGENSGILGKARYMAPEVVTGSKMPSKQTDRYSLSVVLFLLFYGNHPLEGARVLACPCMTEKHEKQFYGSEAVFIYNPNNKTNLPVRGVHNNVLRKWPAFPVILRAAFTKEFSEECLNHPEKRCLERDWQKTIQKVRDILVVCPQCKEETFVANAHSAQCVNCGKAIHAEGVMKINDRQILLTPGTKIYLDLDNKPDIQVISVAGDRYPVQLKNLTSVNWTVETPSGKLKSVEPNQTMPVKAGLKVSFGGTMKGEITNY
ncbi:MAG: protein kinase [Bacteroides sp.]